MVKPAVETCIKKRVNTPKKKSSENKRYDDCGNINPANYFFHLRRHDFFELHVSPTSEVYARSLVQYRGRSPFISFRTP
jgi:hypothetical protein